MEKAVYIVAAKRSAIGAFQGAFSTTTAPQLAGEVIAGLSQSLTFSVDLIDEVIMGCVLSAGIGQAPARQAAHFAQIPRSVPATTINKMCGSGMKALMFAYDAISAGAAQAILAGGMESMTNAPYLLPKARSGYRLGHGRCVDHLFFDGLEDAYEQGKLMGAFAEECAKRYQITREAQDAFTVTALERAKNATAAGIFETEIVPIIVQQGKQSACIRADENPEKAQIHKIPQLKPVFAQDGTITAANASSISDGAAALLLVDEAFVRQHDLKPLARIVGQASYAQDPAWFTTAPVYAIERLLKAINWKIETVDLFEVNEAFAVVTLAAMQLLQIPHEKMNIYGGATALGHPIGATGARIVVTLLNALKRGGLRRGIASLCIGGGEATAMAIELL